MAISRSVPLTSTFMLTSIIGFLVSTMYIMKLSETWGFTFALLFVIMFISGVISLSNIEADTRHGWERLAIHERPKPENKKVSKKR
ncbi:hypothetical protein JW711_02330 [Candidatus Woesearchaeota archaeon]|nr:hypothetical protein [Candidatus Woesearchaeota archaeon]